MIKDHKLPRLFVAIDTNTVKEFLESYNRIRGVDGDFGIKVNLDLLLNGMTFLHYIIHPVFLDLKIWNGARTMTNVMTKINDLNSDNIVMITAYAHAGELAHYMIETAHNHDIKVIGVTVLTHYSGEHCIALYNCASIQRTVHDLAQRAMRYGYDGYTVPGTCLHALDDIEGIKVVPAVRPEWVSNKEINSQQQIISPALAFERGADIVVCGSPVFTHENPKAALRKILDEISDLR